MKNCEYCGVPNNTKKPHGLGECLKEVNRRLAALERQSSQLASDAETTLGGCLVR